MFQFYPLADEVVLRTTRALLISLFFTFCALSGPLQAQQHGAAIVKQCDGPVRICDTDEDCNADGDACTLEHCDLTIPDTQHCEYRVIHNDDFYDTIIINSAFDIIDPLGAATRSPAAGNAEIGFAAGNTNCVVGGTLPCSIGPDVGGGAGSVTFVENLYQPTALDPTPLTDQASVFVVDACDGPGSVNCNPTTESELRVNAQVSLVSGCVSDGEVNCDDGDACTNDSCDPNTGQCENIEAVNCDDGNACTTESCNPATGECEFNDTVMCDDGDACTTESCNPATGECETEATVTCDDGNACTSDSCDPVTGLCEITDTVSCDDDDACTTEDCDPTSGACQTTATVTCDDGDACTNEFCDPITALCFNTSDVNCDDGNSCTDEACDPGTGACVFTVNGSCNETPAGTDVEVNPIVVDETNSPVTDAPDVSITFEDVQLAGTTTIVVSEYEEGTTPPPSGFKVSGLSGGPLIYDIESTATLASGSTFEICFDYSQSPIAGDPADLALVHEVGGVWVDITSSNDTVDMILCGISDSFSFYAILESFVVVGPLDPVRVGTEVSLGVDVSGPPVADTVRWNWGDGTSTDATVTSSEVVAGHTYDTPGVYTVTAQLLLTSGDVLIETGSAEFRFVVVYDPSSGFVTGSGWIDSPEGAFLAEPTRTGKAEFGFVSRYQKGAQSPSGKTEFQFQAGELSFRSSTYDWLVISGASARLKGTGTINGSGNFGFMLTAVDEALTSSTDVDLFRIKIWDKDHGDAVVYDNELGITDDSSPTTAIASGSIVIHKAKK